MGCRQCCLSVLIPGIFSKILVNSSSTGCQSASFVHIRFIFVRPAVCDAGCILFMPWIYVLIYAPKSAPVNNMEAGGGAGVCGQPPAWEDGRIAPQASRHPLQCIYQANSRGNRQQCLHGSGVSSKRSGPPSTSLSPWLYYFLSIPLEKMAGESLWLRNGRRDSLH